MSMYMNIKYVNLILICNCRLCTYLCIDKNKKEDKRIHSDSNHSDSTALLCM